MIKTRNTRTEQAHRYRSYHDLELSGDSNKTR